MAAKTIRIYDSETQAGKAVAALRNAGFEDVFQFTAARGKTAAAAKARSTLADEIAAAHIWRSHAEIYAAELEKGGSLVSVAPPFGSALNAARILDSFGPTQKGIEQPSKGTGITWDEGAPLSSALQMPVLSSVEHPVETLTGMPSLTQGSGFLSNLFGMKLLSKGKHLANSSFGMPLLSRGKHNASSSMGLPLLSRSATPLSSLLHLRVLK